MLRFGFPWFSAAVGDRVEADVAKIEAGGAEHADAGQRRAPAVGQHRREVGVVHGREDQGDEGAERDIFTITSAAVNFGRFRRAPHQQHGDQQRQQEGDQVEAAGGRRHTLPPGIVTVSNGPAVSASGNPIPWCARKSLA